MAFSLARREVKRLEASVVHLAMLESARSTGISFLHQMSVQDTFQIHTHDYFEFFFVLKGKALHHINGERQLLSQGALVFIRPEDVHYYSFIDHYDMELLSIGIERALIEMTCRYLSIALETFTASALPTQIMFADNDYWPMAEKLLAIESKEPGMERRQFFLSLLPDLLYKMRFAQPLHHQPLPPWLTQLMDEMEKPENFVTGLPRMVQLSGVTQEHLTRVFKRYLGLTPTAFINLKRINHSADLLCKGNMEILDVCYQCGFNNTSSFYVLLRGRSNLRGISLQL